MSLLDALNTFKFFKSSPTRMLIEESCHNVTKSQSLTSNFCKYGVAWKIFGESDSNGFAARLSCRIDKNKLDFYEIKVYGRLTI